MRKNECAIHAHNAIAQLLYAYEMGEARGAEMRWEDVDAAWEHAKKAVTRDQMRAIRRNARRQYRA